LANYDKINLDTTESAGGIRGAHLPGKEVRPVEYENLFQIAASIVSILLGIVKILEVRSRRSCKKQKKPTRTSKKG